MSTPAAPAKGSVNLPGLGKVPKKWFLIVGGGAVVTIAYVLYKRKSTAATTTTATDTGTAALAGQPCTDPVTGESGIYDSTGACIVGSTAASQGGYYSGYGAQGVSGTTPPVPGTGGFTTNGQWSQQAQADLANTGIDAAALAAALGAYLTGGTLTTAQQSLVDSAIADEGYPPVSGASGYPPAMHTSATGGSGSVAGQPCTTASGAAGLTDASGVCQATSTGGGTGGTTAGAISNLRVTGYDHTGVSFAWNSAPGATQGYAWKLTGQGITRSGTTTATHVSVTGLTKAGVYNFGIQALPGGPGNNIHTPSLKG